MQSNLFLFHALLHRLAATSASDIPSYGCATSLLQAKLALRPGDLTAGQRPSEVMLACHDPTIDETHTPLPGRKPVVWLHIKKAAGTTFCCEARRRERITAPNLNCNYGEEVEQGYLGYGWPSNWTCEERASLMATGNFTWTAIERLVHPQDLCHSSFLYGTILRNPLDFIESITTSEGWHRSPKMYLDDLQYFLQHALHQGCQIDVLPDFALDKVNVASQLWFDNFATRSLGGYDLDAVPLGKLNASHLEHAKDVLRRFDIVLLFDLMAEQHSSDVMEDVIGWHVPWERSHENPTESNVTLAAWLSPEQLECLASTNHLDAELVEWVRAEYYP